MTYTFTGKLETDPLYFASNSPPGLNPGMRFRGELVYDIDGMVFTNGGNFYAGSVIS